MAQLTATVLMSSGAPVSVNYDGDGKDGAIDDRKNIISAIKAQVKAGKIDPAKISGFTSSEGSFTLSASELATIVKAKPADPAKGGAAKLFGKVRATIGGVVIEANYPTKKLGDFDGDLKPAELALRAKIQAARKAGGTLAGKTVPGKIKMELEEDEDGTGPKAAVKKIDAPEVSTKPLPPKKAPSPPSDAPPPPSPGPTGVAGAEGGGAKPNYVAVEVTTKGKGGKGKDKATIHYQSDGKPGISEDDAKNFISMYEDTVDSDRRDRSATVKIEGEDAKISKLYAMSKQPIEKDETTTASDEGGDVPLDPASSYIASPTRVNRAHLDAERADMDALIAILLNAIAGGNLDVITSIFDVLAKKSGLTVAEVAAKTAEALGMSDKEAAEFGEKMAAVSKDSSDPKKRAEATAEIQKLQLLLQQNGNRRDQLMQNLRTLLTLNDTMKNGADSLHAWKDKEANHYRWA